MASRFALLLVVAVSLAGCSDESVDQGGQRASSPEPQSADFVHQCDEYAAHPQDPAKWASGVPEDDLVPAPAIKFCTDAVNENPNTPRFEFQLGRAFLSAARYDEAIQHLVRAADLDHGPAFAYLADAYRYGLFGEPDLETAIAYYDIAIENGFMPAEEAKAGIFETDVGVADDIYEDELDQTDRSQSTSSKHFDPTPFSHGNILLALHNGEFAALADHNAYLVNIYLAKINDYFSEPYNMMDEGCSAYANPRVSTAILRKQLSGVGLGLTASPEQRGTAAFNLMGELLKDMAQTGGTRVMQGSMNIEEFKRAATRDGVQLARRYGCDNPVFLRLYANIEAYAHGSAPKFLFGLPGLVRKCEQYALARGGSKTSAGTVCGCFRGKFERSRVSDNDIEWLTNNYDQGKNFNQIVARYAGLKKEIAGCLF